MLTLPLLVALFLSSPLGATPTDPAQEKLEKQALHMPFQLFSRSDLGTRVSIDKLLERDDVQGVAVTFVASFMDSFERTGPELQKLYDAFRPRGVIILISVEPSSGTTALERVVGENSLTVPISLTEKQWVPFQNLAGEKNQNSWPWTFYVNEEREFVEITRGTPRESILDTLAKPGAGPSTEAPRQDAQSTLEARVQTLSEITLTLPDAEGWKFVGNAEEGAFGRIVLVKGEELGSGQSTGMFPTGVEILPLVGRYEAAVIVTTLDRQVHTGFGSGDIVDPGSKSQILNAQIDLFQRHFAQIRGAQKAQNARLGGQNAGKLRFVGVLPSKESYEITCFCVPMKAYTYMVGVVQPRKAPKELGQEVEQILDRIRFQRDR
jgi:hypothetical protein